MIFFDVDNVTTVYCVRTTNSGVSIRGWLAKAPPIWLMLDRSDQFQWTHLRSRILPRVPQIQECSCDQSAATIQRRLSRVRRVLHRMQFLDQHRGCQIPPIGPKRLDIVSKVPRWRAPQSQRVSTPFDLLQQPNCGQKVPDRKRCRDRRGTRSCTSPKSKIPWTRRMRTNRSRSCLRQRRWGQLCRYLEFQPKSTSPAKEEE